MALGVPPPGDWRDDPIRGEDGYPSVVECERVATWPVIEVGDFEALMDYIGARWSYPDGWEKDASFVNEWGHRKLRYAFSTGGWSGNESLVTHLEANNVAQFIGAWSWRRGGHYEYRFPLKPEYVGEGGTLR